MKEKKKKANSSFFYLAPNNVMSGSSLLEFRNADCLDRDSVIVFLTISIRISVYCSETDHDRFLLNPYPLTILKKFQYHSKLCKLWRQKESLSNLRFRSINRFLSYVIKNCVTGDMFN